MLAMWVLAIGAPLVGAAWAGRAESARAARRRGIIAAAAGAVGGVLLFAGAGGSGLDPSMGWLRLSVPEAWAAPLPCFVGVLGAVAIAMSPLTDLRPRTVANILLVIASSVALVTVRHPIAVGVLWAGSTLPVWAELRARRSTRATARVFAFYMIPSTVLVAIGAVLLSRGAGDAAIFPLALGIVLREAMVPFHSWLPAFVERAPMALVVTFVGPQLGVYAHLRWLSEGLAPQLADAVGAVGAVTAVFAGAMGAVQSRARRALAYLMMSETALVAFGLETDSAAARAGTLVSWLVCGLALGGFAMAMAALEARRGDLSLDRPSGSFARIPLLATAFLVLGLASVGLPGTLGFVGEDLLVQGSVDRFPVLAFALVVATAFNAVTVMRSFFSLFTGTTRHAGEQDLTTRERGALTALLAVLFLGGVAAHSVVQSVVPGSVGAGGNPLPPGSVVEVDPSDPS